MLITGTIYCAGKNLHSYVSMPPGVQHLPVAQSRAARRMYPFSIVLGGLYNSEEVESAVQADPVVREHYAGIDIPNLIAKRTPHPMMAYLSYRTGDKIYWTKHKVSVPRGELILTDGVNMIRSRCGNRISERPPKFSVMSSGEAESTLESAFDAPVPPPRDPPLRMQAVAPADQLPPPPHPQIAPGVSDYTPEPQSLVLCFSAVGFLALLRWLKLA